MKMNPHLFQATAIVHHGFLISAMLPQDPAHAANAKYIVEKLAEGCQGSGVLVVASAHTICGFLANKSSSHCTPDELVKHALTAVHQLVDAWQAPTETMGVAPGPANPPQTSVPPPVPLPLPKFPEPKTPLEVPDFTSGT